jgi:hypothetical protein
LLELGVLYEAALNGTVRIEHYERRFAVVGQKRVGVEVKEHSWRRYEVKDPVVGWCCRFNRPINVALKEGGKTLVIDSGQ